MMAMMTMTTNILTMMTTMMMMVFKTSWIICLFMASVSLRRSSPAVDGLFGIDPSFHSKSVISSHSSIEP